MKKFKKEIIVLIWLYLCVGLITYLYIISTGVTEYNRIGLVLLSYAPLFCIYYAIDTEKDNRKDGNKDSNKYDADINQKKAGGSVCNIYRKILAYDALMLPLYIAWFAVSYNEGGSYNCIVFYISTVVVTHVLAALYTLLYAVTGIEKMALAVVYAIYATEIIYFHLPEISADVLALMAGYSGGLDVYMLLWVARYALLCAVMYGITKLIQHKKQSGIPA